MRVLFTVDSLDPVTGGPARSVPALARALIAQGIDVQIWTNDGSQECYVHNESCASLPIHHGELSQFDSIDLVHDHGVWLPSNHRVAQFSRKRHIPRIVSPRGMLEPWAMNHKRFKKRIAWWLYQHRDLKAASMLHATAAEEARQFRRLGLRSPVIVLPNGVDVPTWIGHEVPVPEGRRVDERKVALFLSRIHPKKGLPMLVAAWDKLRPKGWRMHVVGPDESGHLAEIKALVNQAGLAEEWTFDGPVEGKAKWQHLVDAELFILPTYSENFGISVAEALAAGTPVITTTGAPWSGLEHHQCGWWTEPNEISLFSALRQATELPRESRAEMGERGRRWMARDFTWSGIAAQMADSYRWLLGEGEPPSCLMTGVTDFE